MVSVKVNIYNKDELMYLFKFLKRKGYRWRSGRDLETGSSTDSVLENLKCYHVNIIISVKNKIISYDTAGKGDYSLKEFMRIINFV